MALSKTQTACSKMTQNGYLKWHKDHPELYDELGETPGACWAGACYILDTLGLSFRDEKGDAPPNTYKSFDVNHLPSLRGWAHFFADCKHEVHYFSFYIDDSGAATIVHVYGTLKKKKIDLNNWIDLYNQGKWLDLFSAKNDGIPEVVEQIELFRL